MAYQYKAWNAAMPTTVPMAAVAVGSSATKTMLQIAPPAGRNLTVISWGYTFAALLATSISHTMELVQTDVAATVTAHVASGVQPVDSNYQASQVTLGTSATGYTASAEGATTTTRTFDQQELLNGAATPLNATYFYQFMPDERPVVKPGTFLRVRATSSGVDATSTLNCWVCWAE